MFSINFNFLQTYNFYITLLYNKTQNTYTSATERDTLIEYNSIKRSQTIDSIKK